MESGKRKINMDLLLKMANELNVDVFSYIKKTDINLDQIFMDLLGINYLKI